MSKEVAKNVAIRFTTAIEYLIETGKVETYRQVERESGIEHQRINSIKAFVSGRGRASYPQIEYLVALSEVYKISIVWLVMGEGEMLASNKEYKIPESKSTVLEQKTVEYNADKKPRNIVQRVAKLEAEMASLKSLLG